MARKDKRTTCFEAEVLPYLVSLCVWKELLTDKLLFVFIDNEAAKSCWISGSADSRAAELMIHKGTVLESRLNVTAYFCRVPTHSNVSDGPSRGSFELCLSLGASLLLEPHRMKCKWGDDGWGEGNDLPQLITSWCQKGECPLVSDLQFALAFQLN